MWESTRYRSRASSAPANDCGDRKRRQTAARGLTMKRSEAEIFVSSRHGEPPTPMEARVVLNDVTETGLTLFAPRELAIDQPVQIVLTLPRGIILRGKVSYCAVFNLSSRIHAKQSFPYRVKIEFEFADGIERAIMRGFCEQLATTILGKGLPA